MPKSNYLSVVSFINKLRLEKLKTFVNFGPKLYVKLRCDTRFQRSFTACGCIFKEITLLGLNQSNFYESTTTCSKSTLKTRVATQL